MIFLEYFVRNGIEVHTQIVMCEGINDGTVLRETIERLYDLYPGVRSLAVVPVGLTKFRDKRYPLCAISRKNACNTIKMIERYQNRFLRDNQETRFVFPADEMYLKAGIDLPDYESYEAFEQIENGVGMVRMFMEDAKDALAGLGPLKACYRSVGDGDRGGFLSVFAANRH